MRILSLTGPCKLTFVLENGGWFKRLMPWRIKLILPFLYLRIVSNPTLVVVACANCPVPVPGVERHLDYQRCP